jgi:hypothetical protein
VRALAAMGLRSLRKSTISCSSALASSTPATPASSSKRTPVDFSMYTLALLWDTDVLELNRAAYALLRCDWFVEHLRPAG